MILAKKGHKPVEPVVRCRATWCRSHRDKILVNAGVSVETPLVIDKRVVNEGCDVVVVVPIDKLWNRNSGLVDVDEVIGVVCSVLALQEIMGNTGTCIIIAACDEESVYTRRMDVSSVSQAWQHRDIRPLESEAMHQTIATTAGDRAVPHEAIRVSGWDIGMAVELNLQQHEYFLCGSSRYTWISSDVMDSAADCMGAPQEWGATTLAIRCLRPPPGFLYSSQ